MIELFSFDDDDEEDDDNYDDEHLSHVDLVEHPDQCDPHSIETGSYFVFQPPDDRNIYSHLLLYGDTDFDNDCDDNDGDFVSLLLLLMMMIDYNDDDDDDDW